MLYDKIYTIFYYITLHKIFLIKKIIVYSINFAYFVKAK